MARVNSFGKPLILKAKGDAPRVPQLAALDPEIGAAPMAVSVLTLSAHDYCQGPVNLERVRYVREFREGWSRLGWQSVPGA